MTSLAPVSIPSRERTTVIGHQMRHGSPSIHDLRSHREQTRTLYFSLSPPGPPLLYFIIFDFATNRVNQITRVSSEKKTPISVHGIAISWSIFPNISGILASSRYSGRLPWMSIDTTENCPAIATCITVHLIDRDELSKRKQRGAVLIASRNRSIETQLLI